MSDSYSRGYRRRSSPHRHRSSREERGRRRRSSRERGRRRKSTSRERRGGYSGRSREHVIGYEGDRGGRNRTARDRWTSTDEYKRTGASGYSWGGKYPRTDKRLQLGGRRDQSEPKRQQRTFVVESCFLEVAPLVALLKEKGWKRVTIDEACRARYVDVVVVDGHYSFDKRLYRFRCGLKSRINAKMMSNKVDLHLALIKVKVAAKYAAETFALEGPDAQFSIKKDDVWIWRPEGGYSGVGVRVCTSQNDVKAALAEHAARQGIRERGFRWGRRGIMSRYITNPLLFRKRKFHIRMYYMVLLEGSKGGGVPKRIRTLMLRQGYIFTAGKEYRSGDWADTKVHDTHLTTTDGIIEFPRDFPSGCAVDAQGVFQQMKDCLCVTSRICAPTFRIYNESDSAFEVFGVDFMVTSEGKVVLIEVNFKPGYGAMKKKPSMLYNNVYNFILASQPDFKLDTNDKLEHLSAIWLYDSAAPVLNNVPSATAVPKR